MGTVRRWISELLTGAIVGAFGGFLLNFLASRRRQLYGRHAVDSGAEVLGTITRKRREGGIDLGDGAAPPFNLGNMLRATGRKVEAEAALRAATRADPMFAEAWYNLSDLLDEQGRSQTAVDCLRRALEAAPDYVDAMFNLALLLQRNNKHAEAAKYWQRYLTDAQSEWAALSAAIPKILQNATATWLIAAVFQVAACDAPRRPWRGRRCDQRELSAGDSG